MRSRTKRIRVSAAAQGRSTGGLQARSGLVEHGRQSGLCRRTGCVDRPCGRAVSSSGAVSPVDAGDGEHDAGHDAGQAVGSTTRGSSSSAGRPARSAPRAARRAPAAASPRWSGRRRQHQDTSASDAANAEALRSRPGPRSAKTNRPATIDGMPVITSTKKRTAGPTDRGRTRRGRSPASRPMGTAIAAATTAPACR